MTSGQPDISLLVPIYNVERYLSQCLDSAISQTLQNIEIVLINDGSTDGSQGIIEQYAAKDPRIKVIDKPNSGYGCSMNRGLDEATGKYIGILESDDFFEPDALEILFSSAEQAHADVAKADFYFYWSTPREKNVQFKWVDKDMAGVCSPLDCEEVFFRKPSIWSAIYRRDFLEANDIRFLETPGASYQDAGFNFKVWASAQTVVLIDKPVLHYRQDNESSSVNSPGKVYCVCDEYAEMHRYVDAMADEEKQNALRKILVRMRHDSYMWNYDRLSEPLQREFIERMIEDFRKDDQSGFLDASLLDKRKLEDRKLLQEHPDLFHYQHSMHVDHGAKLAIKKYYEAGGLPYLVKLVGLKLRG